ncbi:MAG: hypothetical protein RL885_32020 [Planctomycetota bacterium]
MKRFSFRLERVLSLHRSQLRACELAVSVANRRVAEAQALVEQRLQEWRDAASKTSDAIARSAPSALAWISRATEAAERAVVQARSDVERAEALKVETIARLREARTIVEALEGLRKQQERQHRRDRLRQEEKAMDERHLWSMVDEQSGGDNAEDPGKD